jgi:hypothetical protein
MKRAITTADLILITKTAARIRKLSEYAQRLSVSLDQDKRDMRTADKDFRRHERQLCNSFLPKKRRRKIERQIQEYYEWLDHTTSELERKKAEFSQAISEIETELSELVQIHEAQTKVHQFDHELIEASV